MKKLTKKSILEIIKKGGGECPNPECDEDYQIDGDSYECQEEGIVTHAVECNHCGWEWTEVFVLYKIRDIVNNDMESIDADGVGISIKRLSI